MLAYSRIMEPSPYSSRVHEVWARFFGSSFEDRLRYTQSTCFETFPLPDAIHPRQKLDQVGEAYYQARLYAVLSDTGKGLTKTYNRFHDPNERDKAVLNLLPSCLIADSAVLDAYGWTDIPTDCGFLLDYETDGGETSSRKKPWRYRWPDEVHDEVLSRLMRI